MAGKIVADTLEHSTSGSVDTKFVVEGSNKVWCNINGTSTIATRDSLNISSISDTNTGRYSFSFTSSMNDTNYLAAYSNDYNDAVGTLYQYDGEIFSRATGSHGIASWNDSTYQDQDYVQSFIWGDLA